MADGPDGEYLTDRLTDEAIALIEQKSEAPFFLNLWHYAVHTELSETQQLLIQDSRAPEELYDIHNDPFEWNNLADEPKYREELERMRGALDDWRAKYGDKGEIPETEMVEQMWPVGKQPQTSAPFMMPINVENPVDENPVFVIRQPKRFDSMCAIVPGIARDCSRFA